jgi:hypothetical protein
MHYAFVDHLNNYPQRLLCDVRDGHTADTFWHHFLAYTTDFLVLNPEINCSPQLVLVLNVFATWVEEQITLLIGHPPMIMVSMMAMMTMTMTMRK